MHTTHTVHTRTCKYCTCTCTCMCITCALHVHYMYITCALHVHYMYITCALHVHIFYSCQNTCTSSKHELFVRNSTCTCSNNYVFRSDKTGIQCTYYMSMYTYPVNKCHCLNLYLRLLNRLLAKQRHTEWPRLQTCNQTQIINKSPTTTHAQYMHTLIYYYYLDSSDNPNKGECVCACVYCMPVKNEA